MKYDPALQPLHYRSDLLLRAIAEQAVAVDGYELALTLGLTSEQAVASLDDLIDEGWVEHLGNWWVQMTALGGSMLEVEW